MTATPRAEIEIALAGGRDQPDALAALERDIDSGEDGKQMRLGNLAHGDLLWISGFWLWIQGRSGSAHRLRKALRGPEIKVPPFQGGTNNNILLAGRTVNSRIDLADAANTAVFSWR